MNIKKMMCMEFLQYTECIANHPSKNSNNINIKQYSIVNVAKMSSFYLQNTTNLSNFQTTRNALHINAVFTINQRKSFVIHQICEIFSTNSLNNADNSSSL